MDTLLEPRKSDQSVFWKVAFLFIENLGIFVGGVSGCLPRSIGD
jgi:hypothetical protein